MLSLSVKTPKFYLNPQTEKSRLDYNLVDSADPHNNLYDSKTWIVLEDMQTVFT